MAKTVEMCNMDILIAMEVFAKLNAGKVRVRERWGTPDTVIITDIEPSQLVYPEGWYYAKGSFQNKNTSTTGGYCQVHMQKSNGKSWADLAKYCTLHS
jgi:hypothetical protein